MAVRGRQKLESIFCCCGGVAVLSIGGQCYFSPSPKQKSEVVVLRMDRAV